MPTSVVTPLDPIKKNAVLADDFKARMESVGFGYAMSHLRTRYPGEHKVYFDAHDDPAAPHLELPSSFLIVNAGIGMAVIDARVLLYFLGIRMTKSGQLLDRIDNPQNEVVIEQFNSPGQPVTPLTLQHLRTHEVPKLPDIETHLIEMLLLRNKDLAHLDTQVHTHNATRRGLGQVFLLTIKYMERFYIELGMQPPLTHTQLIADTDQSLPAKIP